MSQSIPSPQDSAHSAEEDEERLQEPEMMDNAKEIKSSQHSGTGAHMITQIIFLIAGPNE